MSIYNKGLIYILECIDSSCDYVYIGSTTNIVRRMYIHKSKCNNANDKAYNNKKYQYIRDNGGWENWKYKILELYPCNNKSELHLREKYYLTKFPLNLNKNVPGQTKKEYYQLHNVAILMRKKEKTNCECGGIYSRVHKARHFKSIKHLNYINNAEMPESSYICPSDS